MHVKLSATFIVRNARQSVISILERRAMTEHGYYANTRHIIIGVFPAQKSRGVFENALRILPVPEGDDPLGDIT